MLFQLFILVENIDFIEIGLYKSQLSTLSAEYRFHFFLNRTMKEHPTFLIKSLVELFKRIATTHKRFDSKVSLMQNEHAYLRNH